MMWKSITWLPFEEIEHDCNERIGTRVINGNILPQDLVVGRESLIYFGQAGDHRCIDAKRIIGRFEGYVSYFWHDNPSGIIRSIRWRNIPKEKFRKILPSRWGEKKYRSRYFEEKKRGANGSRKIEWRQLQKLGRQINSNGPLLTRPAVIREYAEEIIGPSGNASRNFNFLGRLTSNEICVYASAAADGAATKQKC